MAKVEVQVHQLHCLECQAESSGKAEGWKAYVGGGYEGDPIEVLVYCPVCAAREFGDD